MTKRIHIDDLCPGMHIRKLDKSWLETPFFRHSMTVTSDAQIAKLRDSGVRFVDIEAEDAAEPEAVLPIPPLKEAVAQPAVVRHSTCDQEAAPAADSGDDYDHELPMAKKIYREAKQVVQRALNDARMGKEVNADAVSQVVIGLTDSMLRNADALTSLARIKCYDEYTFFHSVNAAVLGLSMGRSLGMDSDALHLLGMGSMLHDIGKMKIPVQILNKPGPLREFEFEIMKQHALRGAEILSKTTGLKEDVIRPALEHHERINGSGYPFGKKRDALTEFGLISSVVDVYDAVTSDRVYHKAMPPHEALRLLFSLGQKGHLDPSFVSRFIRCVGIYPVGSCVTLDTGEIGIIRQINHEDPLAPKIVLVKDADGKLFISPVELDLADPQPAHGKTIMSAVDPVQEGIDPHQYLDKEPVAIAQ